MRTNLNWNSWNHSISKLLAKLIWYLNKRYICYVTCLLSKTRNRSSITRYLVAQKNDQLCKNKIHIFTIKLNQQLQELVNLQAKKVCSTHTKEQNQIYDIGELQISRYTIRIVLKNKKRIRLTIE